MQEVDNSLSGLVDDPAAHVRIAELVFGLRFKDGIFDLNCDSREGAIAHVDAVEALFVKFVNAFKNALAESALVGAAIAGILAVYKGAIRLTVALNVRKGELEILRGIVSRFVPSRHRPLR